MLLFGFLAADTLAVEKKTWELKSYARIYDSWTSQQEKETGEKQSIYRAHIYDSLLFKSATFHDVVK